MQFDKSTSEYGFLHTLAAHFERNGGVLPVVYKNFIITPGLCDVHVHLREPGFVYKESIASGSRAAARGGFTAICSMPNVNPVPDSFENLKIQLDAISKDALIKVVPYGAITKGQNGRELSDMDAISRYVCAFSDDGKGVNDQETMRAALKKAKSLNKIVAAHCEDDSLIDGGFIHDGKYAKSHGHKGICSASEYKAVARDLVLARETGAKYHVCHVSTKESVDLIRQAKREGVDVTCETAPHYLVFCDEDIKEDGRFKMNPPLRSREDMTALREGVADGTIDMIATDHAPHSQEEKSRGLKDSAFGIVGLETSFAALYTKLVRSGFLSLNRLVELMSRNPRQRFDIPLSKQDFCVWDVGAPFKVDANDFVSKGKSTPFDGEELYGKCILTVYGGKKVWQDLQTKNLF